MSVVLTIFFFQAEDGIRDLTVTGVQTCALPILNVGQVYKTLGRLERDGLAESEGNGDDGPQKRFRITADGEAELAAWLRTRSEERRVGKSVDLGGRRIIKKKKREQ